jgi:hypothetical protein
MTFCKIDRSAAKVVVANLIAVISGISFRILPKALATGDTEIHHRRHDFTYFPASPSKSDSFASSVDIRIVFICYGSTLVNGRKYTG